MSGPDAGGAYVRQPDGSLTRLERTIGPTELPAPESAEAILPPPARKATATKPEEMS